MLVQYRVNDATDRHLQASIDAYLSHAEFSENSSVTARILRSRMYLMKGTTARPAPRTTTDQECILREFHTSQMASDTD